MEINVVTMHKVLETMLQQMRSVNQNQRWSFAKGECVTFILDRQWMTLQQTLNGLDIWVEEHKIKPNPRKCKVYHVTSMRHVPALLTLSVVLDACDTVKVLGVTILFNLKWDSQVDHVDRKALYLHSRIAHSSREMHQRCLGFARKLPKSNFRDWLRPPPPPFKGELTGCLTRNWPTQDAKLRDTRDHKSPICTGL